jgi:hypothetical protein
MVKGGPLAAHEPQKDKYYFNLVLLPSERMGV